MIKRLLTGFLTLTGLLPLLAAPAAAQVGLPGRAITPLQEQLAAATEVDCTFTTMVTGDWDGAETLVETMPTELEVTFTNVSTDEGTADAGTDFGPAFIVVNFTNDYLHFVQMFRAGPLYTTTVMAVEGEDDRLLAAHTRHEYTLVSLPGFTSRPEMYIGSCVVE